MLRALPSSLLCLALIAGCASPAASSPRPGQSTDASPTTVMPSETQAATSPSTAGPTLPPSAFPAPTLPSSASPLPALSPRELGLDIRMTPSRNGTMFVSMPQPAGSVLSLIDQSVGSPLPGWPVFIRGAVVCAQPLPVEDGSVRVVCTLENAQGNMYNPISAFAFDSAGQGLPGWPIQLPGTAYMGRVVGDVLTLAETIPLGDVNPEGLPSHTVGLVTVAADGSVRRGVPIPAVPAWPGDRWAIGPDGVAYGVQGSVASQKVSQVTAIDLTGVRAGWPISIDGIASAPTFGPDGRVVLTVAAPVQYGTTATTRVFIIGRSGQAIAARSSDLAVMTGMLPPTSDGAFECGVPLPRPPIVAPDGAMFVFSVFDEAIYGLDSALKVTSGWPIAAGPLEQPDPWLGQDGISCPSVAVPVVGPDGTLYLPLKARNESVGGRLVAVGPDGRTRTGWPVELRRAGSEFWTVVVGPDGTVYALAIEPEAGGGSSATILALAPDSRVIYSRTILDP